VLNVIAYKSKFIKPNSGLKKWLQINLPRSYVKLAWLKISCEAGTNVHFLVNNQYVACSIKEKKEEKKRKKIENFDFGFVKLEKLE